MCPRFAFRHYTNSSAKGSVLGFILGNEAGQVMEVWFEEHFVNSDHFSVTFKVVIEKGIQQSV